MLSITKPQYHTAISYYAKPGHMYRMTPRMCSVSDHQRSSHTSNALELQDPFGSVSTSRGFLPQVHQPRRRLQLNCPAAIEWEDTWSEIPKLIVAGGKNGRLRRTIQALPRFPIESLLQSGQQHASGSSHNARDMQDVWRAYYIISFLAHAYLWCEGDPPANSTLPAVLAQPWVDVSRALDMPPVLVYATYNLLNWRLIDDDGPVELGNIVCQQNFMASMDEEWFRLVHIAIEAIAAPGIAALQPMIAAAHQSDTEGVMSGLHQVTAVLKSMQATLARMGEKCDPYVYYSRVRQPMSGWRNNPALPGGLIYEGVTGVDGKPLQLQLYGETGAQSSIVPAVDIALGIHHEQDWLQQYLLDMRGHMPPAHRQFLTDLQKAASPPSSKQPGVEDSCSVVRSFSKSQGNALLREAYNDAVKELENFRSQHKAFAYNYIAKWAKQETKGTGGTDFMPALSGYRNTTAAHELRG